MTEDDLWWMFKWWVIAFVFGLVTGGGYVGMLWYASSAAA